MNFPEGPLVGPPPSEVPLASAPLIRVIAQVRFPVVASIENPDFIAPFQEAIRSGYPVLRPEESQSVTFGPTGVQAARKSIIWRFHAPKTGWKLTLAPDFMALETDNYSSRDDFMSRFEVALEALSSHVRPGFIDRLGVRYIDRLVGADVSQITGLVRPEVLGILGTDYLASHTNHSICEQVFDLPDGTGKLMARWGLIPARSTVDPSTVDPVDTPSWLLDLDAFRLFESSSTELDVQKTVELARSFSERIYKFFRWAVEDEFLRRYEGEA